MHEEQPSNLRSDARPLTPTGTPSLPAAGEEQVEADEALSEEVVPEQHRRPLARRSSSVLSNSAVVRSRRLVYNHIISWGTPLPSDVPEALDVLGVTERHWRQLQTAYHDVVVTRGNQWQHIHRSIAHGLFLMFFCFALLLVLFWYILDDDNDELLASIGLVGVFVTMGLTLLTNIAHEMARNRIVLYPLQNDVVQRWNTTIIRRRDRLPIRIVLRRQVTCRDRHYCLAFVYRPGYDSNNRQDDDTVASEVEEEELSEETGIRL
jgi:hypothetical protein